MVPMSNLIYYNGSPVTAQEARADMQLANVPEWAIQEYIATAVPFSNPNHGKDGRFAPTPPEALSGNKRKSIWDFPVSSEVEELESAWVGGISDFGDKLAPNGFFSPIR